MTTEPASTPEPGAIVAEHHYGAVEPFELFDVQRGRELTLTIAGGYAPVVGLFLARGFSKYRNNPAHTIIAASIPRLARVLTTTVAGTAEDPAAFRRLLDNQALPRLAKLIEDAEADQLDELQLNEAGA